MTLGDPGTGSGSIEIIPCPLDASRQRNLCDRASRSVQKLDRLRRKAASAQNQELSWTTQGTQESQRAQLAQDCNWILALCELGRLSKVVAKQSAEALSACDWPFGRTHFISRIDQAIAETLMIPFVMIVCQELVDRIAE